MPIELMVTIGVTSLLTFGILYFRVPAFAVIYSLLVGQVLSMQASADIYKFITDLFNLGKYDYVQVALLILPIILTVMFLKGRAAKNRLMYELVPAVFAAIALLVLLYPYVPFVRTLLDIATSDQIEGYRSASLIIASVLGLVSVWVSFPKPEHHKGKHH